MPHNSTNNSKNKNHENDAQSPPLDLRHLETEAEHHERWASIRIMYFTVFLMSLGFSIVITGVWPYLNKLDPDATKEFMGYVVAAHPFAQMLFSPFVGWWGNKLGRIRIPLISTVTVFILASAVYSSIEVFSTNRKYWLLVARLFVGVSSANMALCRSYVSAATKLEERTRAVSMISLAQLLGFIVGPGLQAAVTPLGEKGFPIIKDTLTLNMYTAAGWINVLLGIVNLVLVLPRFFREKTIAAKEAMLLSSAASEKDAWKQLKPDYVSAWTLIAAFFIFTFNFVLLESLGTALTKDQFAWSNKQALSYLGIMLSVGGLVACVVSAMLDKISKKFGEVRVLLYGGFLLMVVGRVVCIPFGTDPPIIAYPPNFTDSENVTEVLGCPVSQAWCSTTPAMTLNQFLVGFAFTCIGYPIGISLIQALFSKTLGPRPQGVWMGLITGSGCLSRVCGPVFVVYIYTRLGTIWTFGTTALMMVLGMLWFKICSKRLTRSCIEAMSHLAQPNTKTDVEMTEFIAEL
ncbi:Major Facilitator Superfamily [Nesidiocoris tenuis]|uniref:Major Facilitator Superfamily n=1 Tax=Nesidiocoris tenuis TaxID=355587 RepID=A0ABN7ANZ5_9HEMI|nr:Major Facilitator Superfamily [Nesidiocoris tenuis]